MQDNEIGRTSKNSSYRNSAGAAPESNLLQGTSTRKQKADRPKRVMEEGRPVIKSTMSRRQENFCRRRRMLVTNNAIVEMGGFLTSLSLYAGCMQHRVRSIVGL